MVSMPNGYVYVHNNPVSWVDPWGLTWEYSQSSGKLTYVDNETGERTEVATGYAGHGKGVNNPEMQNVPNVGPLPQGTYTIGPGYKGRLGPVTMNLDPRPDNNMFGRDLFRIHGDNSKLNNTASEGCIIFGRKTRDKINGSDDRELVVIE